MSNTHGGMSYGLIAGLVVVAGALTWLTLGYFRGSTAPGANAPSEPAVVAAPAAKSGAAMVAPQVTSPGLARNDAAPTVELTGPDQRQIAKITRGLRAYPAGGILIESTPAGSVASLLGVEAGDVIVTINGETVGSLDEFARVYREQGLPVQMTIIHNGKEVHRH